MSEQKILNQGLHQLYELYFILIKHFANRTYILALTKCLSSYTEQGNINASDIFVNLYTCEDTVHLLQSCIHHCFPLYRNKTLKKFGSISIDPIKNL